ncbi:hypothetical protein HK097_009747, partial [Rhizophlyctis rosea]
MLSVTAPLRHSISRTKPYHPSASFKLLRHFSRQRPTAYSSTRQNAPADNANPKTDSADDSVEPVTPDLTDDLLVFDFSSVKQKHPIGPESVQTLVELSKTFAPASETNSTRQSSFTFADSLFEPWDASKSSPVETSNDSPPKVKTKHSPKPQSSRSKNTVPRQSTIRHGPTPSPTPASTIKNQLPSTPSPAPPQPPSPPSPSTDNQKSTFPELQQSPSPEPTELVVKVKVNPIERLRSFLYKVDANPADVWQAFAVYRKQSGTDVRAIKGIEPTDKRDLLAILVKDTHERRHKRIWDILNLFSENGGTLISLDFDAYLEAVGGKLVFDTSQDVLTLMRKHSIPYTTSLFNKILKSLSTKHSLPNFRRTMHTMEAENVPLDNESYQLIISTFLDAARLSSTPPDYASKHLSVASQYAIQALRNPSLTLHPKSVFRNLISDLILETSKDLEKTSTTEELSRLALSSKHLPHAPQIYNVLIKMYLEKDDEAQAWKTIDKARGAGLQYHNEGSCYAFIVYYWRRGEVSRAEEVFETYENDVARRPREVKPGDSSMRKGKKPPSTKRHPNAAIYRAMVLGYAHHDLPLSALHILRIKMKELNIPRPAHLFAEVIFSLEKMGRLPEAIQVIEEME